MNDTKATDAGTADTGTLSTIAPELPAWVDRRWEGASMARVLDVERVALSRYGWQDDGSVYHGRAWILDDARDGATEADAVAAGTLEVWDLLGDIDGDGVDEWLGGDQSEVWVMAGAATGELSSTTSLGVAQLFEATGSPDLDGDELPDLVGAVSGVSVWSGIDPGLGPVASFSTDDLGYWTAVGPGDIDGDGLGDLVFDGTSATTNLRYLAGPLAGVYRAEDAIDLEEPYDGAVAQTLAGAGDLDGDGLDDLAAAMGSQIALYTAAGALAAVLVGSDGLGLSTRGSGDLDGDGRSDLAVGMGEATWILRGPLEGSADLDDVATLLEGRAGRIHVGDVDGDAIADLMLGVGTGESSGYSDDEAVLVGLGPF